MDHAAEGLGEAVGPDQADPPAGRLRDQVGRDGPAAQQHPAEPRRLVAGGQQPPQHGRDQRDQGGLAGGGPDRRGVETLVDLDGQAGVPGAGDHGQPGHPVQGQAAQPAVAGAGGQRPRGGQGRPADGVGAQLDHLGGAAGARGGQHRGQARLGRLAPGQAPAPLAVEQVGRAGGGQGALELGRRGVGVERQDRLPRLPGGHHRPGGGRTGQGDGDQGNGLRHGQVG